MFQHRSVCSHEANKERLLFDRNIFPSKYKIITCRQLSTWRYKTNLYLICQSTLARSIPSVEVVLLTTIDDVEWCLMRRMTCTWCQQHVPRSIRCASCVFSKVCDGVVAQIFSEVVTGPVRTIGGDMRVVAHNFRAVLVCLCIEKSVKAIEAACKWPTIKRTSRSGFC